MASFFERSFRQVSLIGLAVCAISLVAVVSNPNIARAAAATSPTGALGSVDMQKAIDADASRPSVQQAMDAMAQPYDSAFQLEQASAMLSVDDQETLAGLLLKTAKVQTDEDQIKALQTKSLNDATELATLQQKNPPTDADQARLTVLSNEKRDGQAALQAVRDAFDQQLREQRTNYLASDVRTAVASVAEQKGLAVVFDSSLAVYASNDVTALVISKLSASK